MNRGTLGIPSGRGLELRSLGDVSQQAARAGVAAYGQQPSWNPTGNLFELSRGPLFDSRNSAYNASPGNLFNWHAAAGKARQGVSNAGICLIGDSTSSGAGLAGATIVGTAFQLQKMSAARGYLSYSYEATWGSHGAQTGAQTFADVETRVVLGSGWANNNGIGGGGYRVDNGAAGTFAFTPTQPFDRVRVWSLVNGTNFGTVSVSVDGGSVGTTTTRTSGISLANDTFTTTLGTHTITLGASGTGSSGRTDLYGVDVWDSTKTGMRVYNMAKGGSKTPDYVVGPFDPRATWAPSLTIVNLTINDSETGAWTNLNTYRDNYQGIINTAKLTGDVLMITGNWTNNTSAGYGRSEPYHEVNYALALANNCTLIDLRHRWPSYTQQQSAGLMTDSLHPSVAGYQDIAQCIFNVIQ